jgi:hypothetical protein
MSTLATPTPSDTVAQIAQAKEFTEVGTGLFLSTFAAVPDDKLNYSPSATSKSPLRLAGHVSVAANAFASLLRGEPAPEIPLADMVAWMDEEEKKIATRDEAVQALTSSKEAVISAIDGLTPEAIARTINTPFGEFPTPFLMSLCGLHPACHAAQVDYVQTTYGDLENHFPM